MSVDVSKGFIGLLLGWMSSSHVYSYVKSEHEYIALKDTAWNNNACVCDMVFPQKV